MAKEGSNQQTLSGRDPYNSLSGTQDRVSLSKIQPNSSNRQIASPSLAEFREHEGRTNRKRRLYALWQHICRDGYLSQEHPRGRSEGTVSSLTPDKAEKLRASYEDELLGRCGAQSSRRQIGWTEFKDYAEAKETELWNIFHSELDLDGNGHLDARELDLAFRKSGIVLSSADLSEFISFLASTSQSRSISFDEFRDYFLLLPHKISPSEIYKYYEMTKFLGDDGRGPARVTMEGDVSLSAEDKPPSSNPNANQAYAIPQAQPQHEDGEEIDEDDHHAFIEHHTALKFLLAGGIAGAVSRTCTAPFDRLKIFLITRPPDLGGTSLGSKTGIGGVKMIWTAIARIYAEGGFLSFWTGNGLSVVKIFPESAIKFFTYESSKRMFAQYWDHVDDPRDISGTQMMSSAGAQKRTLVEATRHLWALGGFGAYYHMSTFEALKLAYLRSTGKDEPGVLALLAFGSISGSVGATSVYPMNLVRTRLQASGSSGHPQTYTGPLDVVAKTWEREGWRGFYRGLVPTLAKAWRMRYSTYYNTASPYYPSFNVFHLVSFRLD
ncbi:hypothetical protein D9758_008886 [Tetrapyrgos nigripes]|uniref:EF-hand domain-containing protein n=1 Tax=Tetrapyrgos nigripes TaxID=182062 RepID=A0A8H5CLT1_9AGAR|nr:hypothetical protein D9758_008886 [Tetrapyrgos nigripes]